MSGARDHGGDLDRAMAEFGGAAHEWLDLSTGINPRPYPLPPLRPRDWTALPTGVALEALARTAARAYGSPVLPVPLAGAHAAVQIVPHVAPPGPARVLGPTYNEHAAALRAAGRRVLQVAAPGDLAGAAVAVVVNPNNPDGRRHTPAALAVLAGKVGCLVVDESFADPDPALSLAPRLETLDNVIVLRSFGKFYGLAGVRLGFALTAQPLARRIAAAAGPWAVSGPAIAVGRAALADTAWQAGTTARLARDAARLDALAEGAGWALVGGTSLFRTYDTADSAAAQTRLARDRIWSRIFPYSARWIRLGLPDGDAAWQRLLRALG